MTDKLNPMLARLELLQAVADGAVSAHYPLWPASPYVLWDRGPAHSIGGQRYLKVSARAQALEKAGLVRIGYQREAPFGSAQLFEITAAGLELLEATRG